MAILCIWSVLKHTKTYLMSLVVTKYPAPRNTHKGLKMLRCVSGTDSQLKQKRSKALPLGESATSEAQPISFAVGG